MYYQARFPFRQGHFHLRLFKNGTIRGMVDVDPPGLDAKGLMDLWGALASAVFTVAGEYVSLDQIAIDDLRELNVDSKDPEMRQLLHLSGIKSGMAYSSLLESYIRIYEKGQGVRIESGGKNAWQLFRGLMRPLTVEEELARMPTELMAALNQTRDQVNEQITVLSQGMANVFQQQQHDHELTLHLTSVFTVLNEKLGGFIDELRKDRESREHREENLNDTVEILLAEREIENRLKDVTEKKL